MCLLEIIYALREPAAGILRTSKYIGMATLRIVCELYVQRLT